VLNQQACVSAEALSDLMAKLESETDLLGPSDERTLMAANELAVAFWCAGEVEQAIALLDQALDRADGRGQPARFDLLTTLGEIMFEQRNFEQACAIQREVLAYHVSDKGACHPKSLAARGDLAAMLFGQGKDQEAAGIQRLAYEDAQAHLGITHPVSCVLAWNCVQNYERCGDSESARRIVADNLAWLLAEDVSGLEDHQITVRSILAERLNWDKAATC
jgi:tetratricopeptide (TPR) repeat protein